MSFRTVRELTTLFYQWLLIARLLRTITKAIWPLDLKQCILLHLLWVDTVNNLGAATRCPRAITVGGNRLM